MGVRLPHSSISGRSNGRCREALRPGYVRCDLWRMSTRAAGGVFTMRVRAVSLTGAFVLAAAGLIAVPSGVAQAAACAGGFDANGDGVEDAVFGMPNEDVGNPVQKDAGVVTVVYGNSVSHTFSTNSVLITEELAGGGKSEANDRFGAAVAVGDLNGDGCKDLVIGSPGENSRAGRFVVIYSKSDGSGLDL